ncbi:hypothetical protein SPRG_19284 [Saprolegnia parasitica CBS 223.65]|uniref:Uncharacterized protein n=1 Tax=Saprolegnia parasitica (strain CBS 223.65) TaxID=695850 RepID=A0A067CSM5_SAPPC|nr:hypothetical protein SPRG_19284 [Saprolegnia parasitica CBS 223.65]KDO33674.1 hypothetical protein SPRG_19284 [Saprolegnia parasitica CBS 223.65]|eukprot:XP_012195701.1 hypothetical protein SPRG_19284 [Saprolegnia parasitica CBS 223.65]
MGVQYRTKTLLHVTLSVPTGAVPRIVPVSIYIFPGEALTWFNEPGRDPTYLNQIVDGLGQGSEWAYLQTQIERASQPDKKDKAPPSREVVLGAIKFTYVVKPIGRSYTVMRPGDDGRALPIPLSAVEVVVHAFPKHMSTNATQPSITDFLVQQAD